LPEFIGPLSMRAATDKEKYDEFIELSDFLTGDGKRRKEAAAELAGDAPAGKEKKKKKGK